MSQLRGSIEQTDAAGKPDNRRPRERCMPGWTQFGNWMRFRHLDGGDGLDGAFTSPSGTQFGREP